MSKPSSIPWWAALGFRKREAAPDTDYADMGTAFGLDASLPTRPMDESADPQDAGRPPLAGDGRKPSG